MDGETTNSNIILTDRTMLMLLTVPYTLEQKKSLTVERIIHLQELIQMGNLHLHMAM